MNNTERIQDLESGYKQLLNKTDLLSKHIDGIQEILKNILDKVDPDYGKYIPELGDFIEVDCDGSVIDHGIVTRVGDGFVQIGRLTKSYKWRTKNYYREDLVTYDLRSKDGSSYIYELLRYDLEDSEV